MNRLILAILSASVLALIAIGVLWSSSSGASNLPSDPVPGSIILLPKDSDPDLVISGKNYSPAITIDASRASLTSIKIVESSGIIIKNGTVTGPGGRSYAVHIDRSRGIGIENMTLTGAHRGIVIARSKDVRIANNTLTRLISDGINIGESRSVEVTGNSCSKFNPRRGVYDKNGKRLKDGDHPDCIQAWSRPSSPPVSDVIVSNNRMEGYMQGIFFGNGKRNGVNDGGFDRIRITDNTVKVGMPSGIVLMDGRNSIVTGNKVYTVPGSVLPNGRGTKVKANLRVAGEGPFRACGNLVEAVPNAPATVRCR